MTSRILTAVLRGAVALTCAAALGGCAGWLRDPDSYQTRVRAPESPTQLSGQVLVLKKERMRRVYRDVVYLRDTVESLRRHGDTEGLERIVDLLQPYLENQLDPLLSDREHSWHPELLPLDANLLFAKADVLIEMRDRWEVWRVIREIERRFEGMESMPVDYPIGEKSTVAQGLRDLIRRRKQI